MLVLWATPTSISFYFRIISCLQNTIMKSRKKKKNATVDKNTIIGKSSEKGRELPSLKE